MHFIKHWLAKDKATKHVIESPRLQKEPALQLAAKIPDALLPLWQLHKGHQVIEINWNSSKRAYQSMILAIDVQRGFLWLDDLLPEQLMLEVGHEVTLRHVQGAKALTIKGEVIAFGKDYGGRGFAIALPARVDYLSRRMHPRYMPLANQPVLVSIRCEGENPMIGTLEDISAGGLRVYFAGNHTHNLRHGSTVHFCDISFGKNLNLQEQGSICAFRFIKNPSRGTQVSIAFADVSTSSCAERTETIYKWLNSAINLRSA